jgi:hypothetical protein
MVRTQIQLTKTQMASVKKLSEQRSVSMAETIRLAIEQLTEQSRHSSGGRERSARALAAIGRFRSGEADLSTNHDNYFAEGSMR